MKNNTMIPARQAYGIIALYAFMLLWVTFLGLRMYADEIGTDGLLSAVISTGIQSTCVVAVAIIGIFFDIRYGGSNAKMIIKIPGIRRRYTSAK